METEEEYRKNLKRFNVTDELPAVITDLRTLPSYYQMMIGEERIEDLSPYIYEDEEWMGMIEPDVLEACQEPGGHIYLAPLSSNVFSCSGVFWNEELFREAGVEKFPDTWGDFWMCCQRLKEHGIAVRYKYCGSTNQKQGVLFSKNGFEFSGSKIDRQFSYSKLNRHFTQAQQQICYRATLAKGFHAAIGNYRSAYTDLFGNAGGSGNKRPIANDSINFGGNIGALPLPPNDSPIGLSAAQLQRKPGESPEEHIARITALLNTVAEVMAIAAMERKRKLRDQKANKPKRKL